jgi:hypothetical protein
MHILAWIDHPCEYVAHINVVTMVMRERESSTKVDGGRGTGVVDRRRILISASKSSARRQRPWDAIAELEESLTELECHNEHIPKPCNCASHQC